MKTRYAILLTLALFLLGSLLRFNIAGNSVPLLCFVILGTALWAAIDSANLRLRDYKSPIAYGPVLIFVGLLLVWVVAFPWYLSVRDQIQGGTAILKTDAKPGVA